MLNTQYFKTSTTLNPHYTTNKKHTTQQKPKKTANTHTQSIMLFF